MRPLVSHGYVATQTPDGFMLLAGDTQLASRWSVSLGRQTETGQRNREGNRLTWIEQATTTRNSPSAFVAVHQVSVDAAGFHHDIELTSLVETAVTVPVSFTFETGMTDQFALRLDSATYPRFTRTLSARLDGATVDVEVSSARNVDTPWRRSMSVQLPSAPTSVDLRDGSDVNVRASWLVELPGFGSRSLAFRACDPHIEMTDLPIIEVHDDLSSLLVTGPNDLAIPAAGAPWFMTLFGRDSLISAYLVRDKAPWLLDNVVRALATTQGTVTDPSRQEEPGKIVHELRSGEFAALDLVPYGRYYGGADTTVLWLAFLGLCSTATILDLEEAGRRALDWVLTKLANDGYVRYRPDPHGLIHQGWKDSQDAILDNGQMPDGPIALVEIQGYCYMALRAASSMAVAWNDPELSDRCERAAEDLRFRFNRDFLSTSIPAVAVTDHPIYATSSNIGHLLMTGILTTGQARRVTDTLLAPDMFTGYGIRTLSETEDHYSPGSYHRGSVWPHDTALAMVGMSMYGWENDAQRLADGLLEVSRQLGGLPEYILGLDSSMPAIKPVHAAMPQAWAAAALHAAQQRSSR